MPAIEPFRMFEFTPFTNHSTFLSNFLRRLSAMIKEMSRRRRREVPDSLPGSRSDILNSFENDSSCQPVRELGADVFAPLPSFELIDPVRSIDFLNAREVEFHGF